MDATETVVEELPAEESFNDERTVLVRRFGPVAHLVLNRPEKLNALNPRIFAGIRDALKALGDEDKVKVVVFRGEGRSFSTGFDMNELGTQHEPRASQRSRLRFEEETPGATFEAIRNFPKVLIAEGKSHVIGIALDFFIAADITICSSDTVFSYPPSRMISATGVNSVWWLLNLGRPLYGEVAFMGRSFSAQEALSRNMISRVVERSQLEATVQAAVDAVCAMPIDGLYIAKHNLKVAAEILGVSASIGPSAMGHAMQVEQKMDKGEWNLYAERNAGGARGATESRDARFKDALHRYNPEGPKV